MTKYIDADALKQLAVKCANISPVTEQNLEEAKKLCSIIDKLPAAPVRPEVHAYWNKKYEKLLPLCSNCGESNLIQMPKRDVKKQYTPFCPHCGATMDGKKEGA